MKAFHQLESVFHLTPLGIRCLDISTGVPVSAGLRVTATSTGFLARPVTALPTRSGGYALHNLPGLHELEYETDPTLTSPPLGKEFAIQVDDLEGRFLSWGVLLTLPRKEVLKAFMFSSPSRPKVAGLLVIRGALKDASRLGPDGSPLPAGYTRIEARHLTNPPTIYVGLADARGQFALFLPFPNPLQPPAGALITSPNTPGRKTLSELRWPVRLSFFYEPGQQKFICAGPDGRLEIVQGQSTPPGRLCVPELISLLRDQSAALIVRPVQGPPTSSLEVEIEFGKDTVVRTASSSQGDVDTSVWIAPQALSSP
jgi:hypothetical protein